MALLPSPAAAAVAPICCASLPLRRASFPAASPSSSTRRLPKFAARSGGGGRTPESKSGDDESKAVLDAFFLGKALAEAVTERVESVVGEVLSVVGQWQSEQHKQVQDFQEEVVQRAQKAKERAATEVVDEKSPKTLREPSTTIVMPATVTPPPPPPPTQAE